MPELIPYALGTALVVGLIVWGIFFRKKEGLPSFKIDDTK